LERWEGFSSYEVPSDFATDNGSVNLPRSEPQYASIEKRLQEAPVIAVPTITIDGEYDPFTPAGDGAAYRDKFSGKYAHETLPVGHNVPQEAPQAFAEAIVEVDGY
jgi:pimeloyl-ACP methyl ester carboxylesterase